MQVRQVRPLPIRSQSHKTREAISRAGDGNWGGGGLSKVGGGGREAGSVSQSRCHYPDATDFSSSSC